MAVSNPATLSSVISEAAASGLGTWDSLYDFRRNGPVLGDSETTIGYGTEASPLKLSQFNGFQFIQYFWFSSAGGVASQPMAIDQNDKIHVITQETTNRYARQYAVTKNGVVEWGRENTAAVTTRDIAFDGSSAIYSAGTVSGGAAYVIKRDTSGNKGFFKQIYLVSTDANISPRIAASASNIYVSLNRTNSNSQSAHGAVKYNSSGTLQWARLLSGEKAAAYAICIDSAENQYYVGIDYSGSFRGYMFKVNSSGTLVWQKLLSVTSGAPDRLSGCAYNNSESALYAVGYNGDYIFKFDTNGNNVWQRKLALGGSGFYEITVGDDGYIYAAAAAPGIDPQKIYVIKIDTSGNLIWQRSWTVGTASSTESAFPQKLVVKGGNLYFSAEHSGTTTKVGTFSTANIVKLPTDGSRTGSLWQATSYTWSTPTTVTLSNGSRTWSTVTPSINSDNTTADTSYTQTITKNSL